MAQEANTTRSLDSSDAAQKDATKPATNAHNIVPLDSTTRTQSIHPSIQEIKLPETHRASQDTTNTTHGNTTNYDSMSLNPLTLQPFTLDELRSHNIESLTRQYQTPDAAAKARDEAARELRKMLDENEKKTREIEREMEEKEKTREIERKVYARKLGRDG